MLIWEIEKWIGSPVHFFFYKVFSLSTPTQENANTCKEDPTVFMFSMNGSSKKHTFPLCIIVYFVSDGTHRSKISET